MGSVEHAQAWILQNCDTPIQVCSIILRFSQQWPIDVIQNCCTQSPNCSTDTLFFNPMFRKPTLNCSAFLSLLQIQDSQDSDPDTKGTHVQHCTTSIFQLHYLL